MWEYTLLMALILHYLRAQHKWIEDDGLFDGYNNWPYIDSWHDIRRQSIAQAALIDQWISTSSKWKTIDIAVYTMQPQLDPTTLMTCAIAKNVSMP